MVSFNYSIDEEGKKFLKKPEEGEVWQSKKDKQYVYIIKVHKNYIEYFGQYEPFEGDLRYYTSHLTAKYDEFGLKNFARLNVYVGKSQVKITDLFKVKQGEK